MGRMYNPSQLSVISNQHRLFAGDSFMEERSDLKITAEMDRISELPTFIVHHIMSYLSAKEVAQTCIFSKRWNYLRKSFPILDFDQTSFTRFSVNSSIISFWRERELFSQASKKFIKFVDTSVYGFCEQKIRMQKFRLHISLLNFRRTSSLVDKWIGLALNSGVKELDVSVITDNVKMYALPPTIFYSQSITTLKIGHCKLQLPLEAVRFHSLRKLTLQQIIINEQTLQKLISLCPLLQVLVFERCWGLKCYCIYKACNLEIIDINLFNCPKGVERIEIVVPSLQQLTLQSTHLRRPFLIDMAGSPYLKILNLASTNFTGQEFSGLISKFPLLEELTVSSCPSLERVIISSVELKKLFLHCCKKLEAVEVDAPNLLSFSYLDNSIPLGSIKSPCPWDVEFWIDHDIDTPWYLDMKQFLGKSNRIKDLYINVKSRKILFNRDEFRERSPALPFEVEKLRVCMRDVPPSSVSTLFDGIFGMCYCRTLSVRTEDKALCLKFIEWLYEELENGDASCCNSHSIKCWRHYLKVVNIESSNDQNPLNVFNLMDACPILPKEMLRFQLGSCFC